MISKNNGKGGIKIKRILFFIFICILLSMPVYSLTASISNPKMVLYKNMSKDGNLVFENSVIVNNENDFDIKIGITPTGDLKDNIKIEEASFVLKPDERREVLYTITINKPGIYNSDILIAFKEINSENKNALALAQTLVVHVKGDNIEDVEDSEVLDNKKDNNKITGKSIKEGKEFTPEKIFIGLSVILVSMIVMFVLRRGK